MLSYDLSASCFIAVDMKSYYASVEAVSRGLDPLKVRLLVADPSRSDQTICLAVDSESFIEKFLVIL